MPGSRFTRAPSLIAALPGRPSARCPGSGWRCGRISTSPRNMRPAARRSTVGEILDRSHRPAGPLVLPLDSLNRHVFVCGATGAGKSQTVRALLEAAHQGRDPLAGGRAGQGRIPADGRAPGRIGARPTAEVVRIRPGESDAIAAGLNPLEPAPDAEGRRFPLQTHADLVKALFIASFRSDEPFPQVLSAALTRVYEDAGWDLALGEPVTPDAEPQLSEPHRSAAGRDQDRPGDRLRPADHRRRARLHQGAAVQPAAGHDRPVPARAATGSTSASCCRPTPCSRSRTWATTATRRS